MILKETEGPAFLMMVLVTDVRAGLKGQMLEENTRNMPKINTAPSDSSYAQSEMIVLL